MYAKPRAAGVLAKTDGMLWKMDRSAFRRLQSTGGRNMDIDLTKVLRKVDVFTSLNYAQLQQLRDEMQARLAVTSVTSVTPVSHDPFHPVHPVCSVTRRRR